MNDGTIDNWPFWMFEEMVKIINDLIEQENKEQKKQQEEQGKYSGGMGDPSKYMKGMSKMSNKFKK